MLLPELEEQARRLGGELSFRKLLRAIAGDRRVVRAICCLPTTAAPAAQRALQAAGFTLRLLAGAVDVALCADLEQVGPEADVVAVAPLSSVLASRLAELRTALPRLEAASFDGVTPEGATARRLGRDCMFVP